MEQAKSIWKQVSELTTHSNIQTDMAFASYVRKTVRKAYHISHSYECTTNAIVQNVLHLEVRQAFSPYVSQMTHGTDPSADSESS